MRAPLSVATDIALLVTALILGAAVAKQAFIDQRTVSNEPQVGTQISLPEVEWRNSARSLLIVISSRCRYCSESAPFYRRLVSEAHAANVRVIALLPQPADEGLAYLRQLAIPVSDVRNLRATNLNVRRTPTLLLVDRKGRVRRVWRGQVPQTHESAVLASVRSDS
jgi:hypothetical protein